MRTFANGTAPPLHARVRSAPPARVPQDVSAWPRQASRGIGFARRRGLASVRAGDWLRSAPGIGFARRPGVGFARRPGVGFVCGRGCGPTRSRFPATRTELHSPQLMPLQPVVTMNRGQKTPWLDPLWVGVRGPHPEGVSLSIPGVSDGPGPGAGRRPDPPSGPDPGAERTRASASRSQSCGSVRIGRRRRLARPCGLAPRRRRTNPSPGAERTRAAAPNEPEPRRRTNPSRGAERTRAAAPNEPEPRRRTNPSRGAERTRAAAPNEPEPRRRTNPSVRLLSATLRSRAAPRAGPGDPTPNRLTTGSSKDTRAGDSAFSESAAGGRASGGWATRERTDSRNREGHPTQNRELSPAPSSYPTGPPLYGMIVANVPGPARATGTAGSPKRRLTRWIGPRVVRIGSKSVHRRRTEGRGRP